MAHGVTGSSETPRVIHNSSSGGTPSGPLPKTVNVAVTNTNANVIVNVIDAEIQAVIEMIAEMIAEDATPETPKNTDLNQNTLRIIRKKIDMMEMTIALTASAIPPNTHTAIPLNNLPHERR